MERSCREESVTKSGGTGSEKGKPDVKMTDKGQNQEQQNQKQQSQKQQSQKQQNQKQQNQGQQDQKQQSQKQQDQEQQNQKQQSQKQQSQKQQNQKQQNKGRKNQVQWKTTGLKIMTGVLGAALLIGGIWQGEYAVTLNKAVRICLECIGIG